MELSKTLIAKIAEYIPDEQTVKLVRNTSVVFLVGIAGAGKDTIQRRLFTTYPGVYHAIVSHTTRAPRENRGIMEREGVEYHFINLKTAESMIDEQRFVEVKVVHQKDVYGTSTAEIKRAHDDGKIAITDLDVQGVDEYEQLSQQVKAVFVLPPSFKVWQQRLTSRYNGQIDWQDLQRRMNTAKEEIEHVLATSYYYIVINDDLDDVTFAVHSVATGHRTERRSQQSVEVAQEILSGINNALSNSSTLDDGVLSTVS
jgi:guanylate kinase